MQYRTKITSLLAVVAMGNLVFTAAAAKEIPVRLPRPANGQGRQDNHGIKNGISKHYDSISGEPLGVRDYCMSSTLVTMMLDRLARKYELKLRDGNPRFLNANARFGTAKFQGSGTRQEFRPASHTPESLGDFRYWLNPNFWTGQGSRLWQSCWRWLPPACGRHNARPA